MSNINGNNFDYEQAAKELLVEAEQGNIEAKNLLAQMFKDGIDAEHDYKQAAVWLQKSDKQGHAETQYYLWLKYPNAQDIKHNQSQSEIHFQEAIKQKNVEPKKSPVSNASVCNAEIPEPQRVSVVNIEVSRRIKKTIIYAAVVIILLSAGCLGVLKYIDLRHEEEMKTKYNEQLSHLVPDMLLGAYYAEDACSLFHDVWYNAIHEKKDSRTDKYTLNFFDVFHDDFNTALMNLRLSDEFMIKITQIKSYQQSAEKIMRELQNPPEEFKNAYPILLNLYEAFIELTNLAINPQGSLMSYTASCNNASSSFMKYYNMIKLYIE